MELINVVLDCWADEPVGEVTFSSGPLGGVSSSGSHASLGKGNASSQGGGRAKALRLASSAAATRDAAATALGTASGGGGLSFDPYCDSFLGPHTVSLLLSGVVDSWDRCVRIELVDFVSVCFDESWNSTVRLQNSVGSARARARP